MTVKLKDFLNSPTASLRNHIEGKLLEDAVIAMLISLAKIAPRHRFADDEKVKLSCMGFHRNDNIAQALTV